MLKHSVSQQIEVPKYKEVKNYFRWPLLLEEQIWLLLGVTGLLAFTFKDVSEQENEYHKYAIAGFGIIGSALAINFIAQATPLLNKLIALLNLREKTSNNNLLIIGGQVPADIASSGILLGAIRILAIGTALDRQSSWLRGAIALATVGSSITIDSILSIKAKNAEQAFSASLISPSDSLVLLKPDFKSRKPFNRYVVIQWLTKFLLNSMLAVLVTESYIIPTAQGFGWNNSSLNIAVPAVTATCAGVLDHPYWRFKLSLWLKKMGRFGRLFITENVIKAFVLFADCAMNLDTVIYKQSDIDINNSTALTTLALTLATSSLLAEVVNKVIKSANDIEADEDFILKMPILFTDLAKSNYWGITIFNNFTGTAAALAAGLLTSISRFIIDKHKCTPKQKIAVSFLQKMNGGFFYVSTLLPEALGWRYKIAITAPLAFVLIGGEQFAKKAVAIKYEKAFVDILKSGLLGLALGKATQQFLLPFGIKFFTDAEYIFMAPLLAKTIQHTYQFYNENRQNKKHQKEISMNSKLKDNKDNYGTIQETITLVQKGEKQVSKFDRPTKIIAGTIKAGVGFAMFNKLVEPTNNEPSVETGYPLTLILLGGYLLLFMYMLYLNAGAKEKLKAVNNGNKQFSEAYSGGEILKKLGCPWFSRSNTKADDSLLLLSSRPENR